MQLRLAQVLAVVIALTAPLPAAAVELDGLFERMSSADVEERREALSLLIDSGALPWEGMEALRRALADPDPGIRREAVEASAMLGPDAEPALPELEALLRDPLLAESAAAAIEAIAGSDYLQSDQINDEIADLNVETLSDTWTDWLFRIRNIMSGPWQYITSEFGETPPLVVGLGFVVMIIITLVVFVAVVVWFVIIMSLESYVGSIWSRLIGLRPSADGGATAREGRTQPERPTSWSAGRLDADAPIRTARDDRLGFAATARNISRFMRHEHTAPGITFAINGPWGSGKSSVMHLLREDLERHGWRAVWFNAWHHQSDEHMFASLVDAVRRGAVPPLWRLQGLWTRLKLAALRLWRQRRLFLALATLAALLVATGGLLQTLGRMSPWQALLGSLADLGGRLSGALGHLADFLLRLIYQDPGTLREPLDEFLGALGMPGEHLWLAALVVLVAVWLLRDRLGSAGMSAAKLLVGAKEQAREPKLRQQLAFRARFAREFHDLTRALGHPRRLFPSPLVVFVDDLDRCRTDAVLEVLEAVNFLVNAGECFVVVAMAREQVEAAVGLVRAEEAAEHTGASAADDSVARRAAREARRSYARDYLEKLVNIEVRVPTPDDERLLQAVSTAASAQPDRERTPAVVLRRAAPVATYGGLFGLAAILLLWPAPEPPGPVAPQEPTAQTAPRQSDPVGPLAIDIEPAAGLTDATTAADPPPVLVAGIVTVVLLGALIGLVRTRARAGPETDSPEFEDLLRIWQPVVAKRRNTARALKRFVNRTRFLAMGLRDADEPESALDRLVVRLTGGEPKRPGGRTGFEPTLVALAAIEHLDAALLQLEALFQNSSRLRQPVRSVDSLVADAVAGHVAAGYAWPPSFDERREFLRLAAGMRIARDPEPREAATELARQAAE